MAFSVAFFSRNGERLTDEKMPSDDRNDSTSWWKYYGVALEFVGVTLLFGYFGYLADEHWDSEPKGMIIGGAIGLIGGMYLMVKAVWPMFRDEDQSRK